MLVFKFGGGVLQDAASIKRLIQLLGNYADAPLAIVVSAFAKTTNHLENISNKTWNGTDVNQEIEQLALFHHELVNELGLGETDVHQTIDAMLKELEKNLAQTYVSYYELNDQVVCFGELLSSQVIHTLLTKHDHQLEWKDARKMIITDGNHGAGNVNWPHTIAQVERETRYCSRIITQGFIARGPNDRTTTLGREGSDFTAAILAKCLKAREVVIWKDVQGILNADPKRFPEAEKFDTLTYQEAAEMSYYGAKVIHPKTIRPLAAAKVPLIVRSYYEPDVPGTVITDQDSFTTRPTIILKENQVLVSFQMPDYTFINERNLGEIFHTLDELSISINVMQNSALSFSIGIDNRPDKVNSLIERLKAYYSIRYNEDLTLITIKHYDENTVKKISANQNILLEQKTRTNYQILVDKTLD